MNAPLRLLLVKCGDAAGLVRAHHGDYEDFFAAVLAHPSVCIETVDVAKGAPLPDHDAVDAAVITGSPASVTEWTPWMQRAGAWCCRAEEAGVPQLGVCFGHQLMARAFGGTVRENPRGFELGTCPVELTSDGLDDPLLGPVAPGGTARFHQIHGDEVGVLPPGALHLARNQTSFIQAFSRSGCAWAVQFHPEMTEAVMHTYVTARAARARASAERRGLDPQSAIAAAKESLTNSPAGPRLLARFVERARALGKQRRGAR